MSPHTATATTFADVALDIIKAHPLNPRRNAVADEALVASVKASGLVQSLVLAPDGDRYVLIDGHRRLDACRKAGLATAPATIRTDVETDAQKLELMLAENGEHLTAIEEAAGYAQLELFGYRVKDIVKATGRSEKTVKQRLKLGDLSHETSEKVHTGQVTITDALELLAFADDPKATEELEKYLGTHNWSWKLAAVKDAQRKADLQSKLRTRIAVQSIPEAVKSGERFDADEGPYPLDWFGPAERDEAIHVVCLAWMELREVVYLVCQDPTLHADDEESGEPTSGDRSDPNPEQAAARKAQQDEWERQRAEQQAIRESEEAAAVVRAAHATTQVEAMKLPDALIDMVRAMLPAYLIQQHQAGSISDHLATALGYEDGAPRYSGTPLAQWIADSVTWSPKQVTRALAVLLIVPGEELLDDPEELENDGDFAQAGAAYLTWLTATDHTFCDIDIEIRNTIDTALTEDDEEAAS